MSDHETFRFDDFLSSISDGETTYTKDAFISKLSGNAKPSEESKNDSKKTYIFDFYFADGIKTVTFKCNTDTLSHRFFKLLFSEDRIANEKKAAESTGKKKRSNNKDYERCNLLFDPNANISDTKRKELYKLLLFVRLFSDYLVKEVKKSYYDYLNLENDGTVLRDSAGRPADMYLLGILFFKKERIGKRIVTDSDYLNTLFPGKTIIEKIQGYEHIVYTPEMAIPQLEALIPVLKNDPLFGYLMRAEWFDELGQKNNKIEDLKLILHHALRYSSEKGFYTLPVIEEIILHERTTAAEFLSKELYSSTAFTHFMGKIAKEASVANARHSIKKSRVLELIYEEAEFGFVIAPPKAEQTEEEIINDAIQQFKDSTEWFGEYFDYSDDPNDPHYSEIRFKNKISRLYYCANNIVQECSEFSLFSTLLQCCEIDINDEDRDMSKKVYRKYDSLILLPAITLHLYPVTTANKFLLYLAEERSQNYAVRDRWKQIISIAIISYAGLFENIMIDNKSREVLFKASYGQNSYEFQLSQAERLLQQQFFKTLLDGQIQQIKENPRGTQPLFFFLYDKITFKNVGKIIEKVDEGKDKDKKYPWPCNTMKRCFEFRAETLKIPNIERTLGYEKWCNFVKEIMGDSPIPKGGNGLTPKSALEFLIPFEKEGRKMFPQAEDQKDVLFLDTIALYSIQAFLFAVFNFGRSNMKSFSDLFNHKDQKNLIKIAVYCDYYTRKNNLLYQRIYSKGSDVGAAEKKNLYLLCGPVRITCLKKYDDKEKLSLPKWMKSDYKNWFANETGRYKILLARLLAYTDFFTETDTMRTTYKPVEQSQFLEYDNIDANKVNQNPTNPLLWYRVEK